METDARKIASGGKWGYVSWHPKGRTEMSGAMISTKPSNLIPSLLATISILGCGGVSSPPVTTTASTLTGSSLRGQGQGGQEPISGATIQLYQVGTAGDGSSAAPLGS